MVEKGAILERFELRMRRLISEHRRLSELCVDLTAERDRLKTDNRSLREQLHTTQGELSRMQLAEGLAGGSKDRDKARARINRLMREVDKCIALLERGTE